MISDQDRIHCPLKQAESPGPLGCQDSASPDNNHISPFTPGTMGVNDKYGEPPDQQKIMLNRLNAAWDDLEDSRKKMADVFSHASNVMLSKGQESDDDDAVAEIWKKHHQISVRYFKLLQDYIKNYYDARADYGVRIKNNIAPKDNWGIYLRTMWLFQGEVMAQHIFSENPYGTETLEMTVKLAVLHCQMAFENYQMTKNAESFFYSLTSFCELGQFAEEFGLGIDIPREFFEMLEKLAEEKKPSTIEEAQQAFIRSLITGLKPKTPLRMREILKVIKPVDPIREHFIRSKGIDGLGG